MLGQYRYDHFHFILPVFILLLCLAEIFFFLSPAPNREQARHDGDRAGEAEGLRLSPDQLNLPNLTKQRLIP
jgi:hypothetical protein